MPIHKVKDKKEYNYDLFYSTGEMKNYTHNIIAINDRHQLSQVAPFYRYKKPTIAVLGVESYCWLMKDAKMRGQCSNINCLKNVHFFSRKPIGHIFFFDIDEKRSLDDTIKAIRKILNQKIDYEIQDFETGEISKINSRKYGFNHFILTETTKGYHVWITEVLPQKVGWFELFTDFKKEFTSDYEFHSQWILRLGAKQNKRKPFFVHAEMLNTTILPNCYLSLAHLVLLKKYAKMPFYWELIITTHGKVINTFARQVIYHSWDIEKAKEIFKDDKENKRQSGLSTRYDALDK